MSKVVFRCSRAEGGNNGEWRQLAFAWAGEGARSWSLSCAATRNCSQSGARASAQEIHWIEMNRLGARIILRTSAAQEIQPHPWPWRDVVFQGKAPSTDSFGRTFPVSCRA